jgi:hypothetical protein
MWFRHGSKKWDEVGKSTYGPPPGFVTGGPNKEYDWDKCCPQNCDSKENNAMCFELDIKPLKNQPAQKSYMDFNQGWPLNSWAVSENSNGYQVQYLRLLSKFENNISQYHTRYANKENCIGNERGTDSSAAAILLQEQGMKCMDYLLYFMISNGLPATWYNSKKYHVIM